MAESDIPPSWARVPLSSLGTFHGGQSMAADKVNRHGDGIPYVSGPDQWDGERFVVSMWTTERARTAPARCIFIVVKGAGGVGSVYPGIEAAIGRNIIAFVPHEPLDLQYMVLALSEQTEMLAERARGHIPGINTKDLRTVSILLPPLHVQAAIVETVSAIGRKLENISRTLSIASSVLDRTLDAALINAFKSDIDPSDGETALQLDPAASPTHSESPLSHNLGKYGLCLGRPPVSTDVRGREWVQLTAVAELESGHTPSRSIPAYWDGDIPWVGIPDARDNDRSVIVDTARHITEAGLLNSSARLLPPATVCLSRTASIGYVAILGRSMATSQDFANWVCGPRLDPLWLQCLLSAEREALRAYGKGSMHKTIYYKDLQNLYVLLPPIEEQERVGLSLSSTMAKVEHLRGRINIGYALSKSLLKRFASWGVRGMLDVPDSPGGESADELIEKLEPVVEKADPKPAAKAREPKIRSSTSPSSLQKVLINYPLGLSPEDAFRAGGYTPEHVDEFFRDVHDLVESGDATYLIGVDRLMALQ